MSSALRRWRWPLGVLLMLLLVLAVCEWLQWPFLRAPLERQLARSLAREVHLGDDFGVRFLGSVRLRSDSLRIGPAPQGPVLRDAAGRPRDFLRAGDVSLALPYRTVRNIVRGERDEPVRVRSLDVGRLELGLVRQADGTANWQMGAPKQPGDRPPELPQFDRLVLRQGELSLDDAVSQLKLEASASTREGSSAAAAVRPDAAGAGERGLVVNAVGSYRKSPLKGQLRSSGLMPIAASDADSPPVAMRLDLQMGDSRLRLDGSGRDVLHLSALDADFDLAGPSLAVMGDAVDVTLPTTAAFTAKGHVRKEGAVWNVAVRDMAIGSSRLRGDFKYDPRPPVPRLSGALVGSHLSLADLGPALGAPAPAPARAAARAARKERVAAAKEGRVLPQREFDVPSLGEMNADVAVDIDRVDLGTPALDQFAPLSGRIKLQSRQLSVADLVARTSGGELRGTLSMDGRQKVPKWGADLRVSGVRLERFIKARNPRDRSSAGAAPASYVSGVLSGQAELRGSGRSVAAMLASLDGTSQLWVNGGRISHLLMEMAGIDLAESLGLLVGGDSTLPVNCAVARFTLKSGEAVPEVGVIDTGDTTVVVSGRISLAEERLKLLVTARPKDFTPVALRGPVHIEGTFGQPTVRPDARSIGLRVAAAAALAAVAPLAALLALIDPGEPEKAVCRDALQRLQAGAKPVPGRAAR